MKKGDSIIMYFHGAGVKKETRKILSFDNLTVTIDDGDNGRTFDRATGKCLTDNNFGGFYRTIKPINA